MKLCRTSLNDLFAATCPVHVSCAKTRITLWDSPIAPPYERPYVMSDHTRWHETSGTTVSVPTPVNGSKTQHSPATTAPVVLAVDVLGLLGAVLLHLLVLMDGSRQKQIPALGRPPPSRLFFDELDCRHL